MCGFHEFMEWPVYNKICLHSKQMRSMTMSNKQTTDDFLEEPEEVSIALHVDY